MIKKFLKKVFSKREKALDAINQADMGSISSAKVITAKTHQINQNLISSGALKTCDGLQKAGFQAIL